LVSARATNSSEDFIAGLVKKQLANREVITDAH